MIRITACLGSGACSRRRPDWTKAESRRQRPVKANLVACSTPDSVQLYCDFEKSQKMSWKDGQDAWRSLEEILERRPARYTFLQLCFPKKSLLLDLEVIDL